MAVVTRLGLSAIPRGLYGDFSGKTIEVADPSHTAELTDWLYRHDRRYLPVAATVGTPAADFRWTAGVPTVQFWDSSVGATSWLWNFAGRGTSVLQNPSFDFFVIGDSESFSVTLQINGEPSLTSIQSVTVDGVASVDLATLTLGQLSVLDLDTLASLLLE